MSAPAKGTSSSAYLGEMVDLLMSFSGRDVVLDRSHYGELVWPLVYGREALLNEEDMESLRELEDSLDTTRVLMHDPNTEAHWKRCVDNKEPLTKAQFVKARTLYSAMADKYAFTRKTLGDFPEAAAIAAQVASTATTKAAVDSAPAQAASPSSSSIPTPKTDVRTPQQQKLDKANAINEVLSKRIIKGKGQMFDDLERSVRGFLNTELGKIFGTTSSATGFSNEEVELLKFFCERLKNKETK